MRRYKLTLAYDGSAFHGWQKQKPIETEAGARPLRTVAGVVEDALRRVMQQPIRLMGASRTDAGVHALGQVAHFDAATRIPDDRVALAINSRLPADVEVRRADPVESTFDAIRSVESKQYRYRIHNASERPLTLRHVVHHCWTPLDVEAMRDAASRLVGRHDFAGFAAADPDRRTTVRTVHRCEVSRVDHEVQVTVEGDGFLYHMVRILAGTLVEVGRGRFEPTRIDHMLQQADRRETGPTLPPQGLCLEWIRYRSERPAQAPLADPADGSIETSAQTSLG